MVGDRYTPYKSQRYESRDHRKATILLYILALRLPQRKDDRREHLHARTAALIAVRPTPDSKRHYQRAK